MSFKKNNSIALIITIIIMIILASIFITFGIGNLNKLYQEDSKNLNLEENFSED